MEVPVPCSHFFDQRKPKNTTFNFSQLHPNIFFKMRSFPSQWMVVLLVAIVMVQTVCSTSTMLPPLEDGVYVIKEIVLPNSTEVTVTDRYTVNFVEVSDTEYEVMIKVGNSMWTTMEINSTVTTDDETVLNVGMSPRIAMTLMMTYGEEYDVEMAILSILPTVNMVIVEEGDIPLDFNVTFLEESGVGAIRLDKDL